MLEQRVTQSHAISKGVIVAYLLIQFAVPAARLVHRPAGRSPARFGWQMFSRIDPQPGIHVIFPDHVDSTSVTSQRTAMRADVQLPPDFARQVCAHYPRATGVVIGRAPEVPCR